MSARNHASWMTSSGEVIDGGFSLSKFVFIAKAMPASQSAGTHVARAYDSVANLIRYSREKSWGASSERSFVSVCLQPRTISTFLSSNLRHSLHLQSFEE